MHHDSSYWQRQWRWWMFHLTSSRVFFVDMNKMPIAMPDRRRNWRSHFIVLVFRCQQQIETKLLLSSLAWPNVLKMKRLGIWKRRTGIFPSRWIFSSVLKLPRPPVQLARFHRPRILVRFALTTAEINSSPTSHVQKWHPVALVVTNLMRKVPFKQPSKRVFEVVLLKHTERAKMRKKQRRRNRRKNLALERWVI